jgi:hypothetical protein
MLARTIWAASGLGLGGLEQRPELLLVRLIHDHEHAQGFFLHRGLVILGHHIVHLAFAGGRGNGVLHHLLQSGFTLGISKGLKLDRCHMFSS